MGTIIPYWGMSSFVIIERREAVFLYRFVTLCALQIFAHHLGDEFVEGGGRLPTQLGVCLGWVAQQGLDFGGAKVAWVGLNDAAFSLKVSALPSCCKTINSRTNFRPFSSVAKNGIRSRVTVVM